jgi:hypothetical protein
MHPDSWLIGTVAAAFFLLGIAASPLAWVVLAHRRSRFERHSEQRLLGLAKELRAVADRLDRCEAAWQGRKEESKSTTAGELLQPRPIRGTAPRRAESQTSAGGDEPPIISVPNLAAETHEREATINGLTQRYAAIWALADSGATPEMIARATGQPIGQIDLILALRRQIDGGTRNSIPHGPHT